MKYPILLFLILQILTASAYARQKVTPKKVATKKSGYSNRMLVIGGGGARGAWSGGFVQRLDKMYGHYRVVYGTSTGSLLAPLIVLDSFDRLKRAYTTVDQSKIFNDNPFNANGNLRGFNAFRQYITGEESFGTTHNLRHLMDTFLTQEDYRLLQSSPDSLRFFVTVVNMKTAQVKYKSSLDNPNDSIMKNWMWASANEPLFMSYYNVGTSAYVDGGVLANVPLSEALEYAQSHNIRYIDVMINKPQFPITDTNFQKRDILSGLERLITLWETQIRNDNVDIGILEALSSASGSESELRKMKESDKITVTIHYFPTYMYKGIFQKELMFDKDRMDSLWSIGRQGIEDTYISEENGKIIKEYNGHTIIIPINDDKPAKKYLRKYKLRKSIKNNQYMKED